MRTLFIECLQAAVLMSFAYAVWFTFAVAL